ncbi:rod shape-determining protein RodA [Patescibacteria group bacterium]|nr:rod shape-determining protein RodA [Patescibacteria group bacterium]
MLNHFRKLDWSLIIAALLLSGAGLLTIRGIGTAEAMIFFKKQFLFLGIGFLLMVILSFFDYRIFKNHSLGLIVIYLVSVVSLVFVLFSEEVRGSSSWFHLGPINFEPIEFIKIVVILILAKYFSSRHIELYRFRHLIVSGAYIGLPALAILFQPDLGSVLVLGGIWLGIVVVSGLKARHLAALFLIAAVLLAVGWTSVLREYQKQRILSFLDPQNDPYGWGYHISQSLIAVGSGRILGQGEEGSSQAGLKFLPEQHNDFIFATLSEQRGLAGVFVLLALYAFFFWRIVKIALVSSNNFSRLFAAGFMAMIFSQAVINIGMNVGVLPITGLTLPLVSYGGSSLISIFLGLGILESIKSRN